MLPDTNPQTVASKELADEIYKKSGGRIIIDIYPNNLLGDYTLLYEEIGRNTLEGGLMCIPTTFEPRMDVIYFPYLSSSYKEAKVSYAPGGFVYDIVSGLSEPAGVKLLAMYIDGFGGMCLSKAPTNPRDPNGAKNVKVRVPPMKTFETFVSRVGYITTSLPYAEVYMAMQTGVCEGWIGGTPRINYEVFLDVMKYWIQYRNWVETSSFVLSMKLWNSLSPEDQKIVQDACVRQALMSSQRAEADEEGYLQKLRDAGKEVVVLTDKEMAAHVQVARSDVWPKLENVVGPEIMAKLKKVM
jgi:TRAP-type C4-dicarboxylate transport system substrate-binding protein